MHFRILVVMLALSPSLAKAQIEIVDIAFDYMDIDRDVSEWSSGTYLSEFDGQSFGASIGFAPEDNESPIAFSLKYVAEETNNSLEKMDTDQLSLELAIGSSGRNGRNVNQVKVGYSYFRQTVPFFDEDIAAHGIYLGYGVGFSISPHFDIAGSIDFFAGETGEDEGYITGPKGDVSLIWTPNIAQRYKIRVGYRFRRFGFSEDDTEFGERFIDDISGPFIGFRFAF